MVKLVCPKPPHLHSCSEVGVLMYVQSLLHPPGVSRGVLVHCPRRWGTRHVWPISVTSVTQEAVLAGGARHCMREFTHLQVCTKLGVGRGAEVC